MMKTAIIGVGRMGRRHIQVVRNAGLDLVGVCDPNEESLAQAAAEGSLARDKLYSDAQALLSKTKPECVIIATTAPFHCQYTCQAAEAGAKFILCEKPMAVSLTECDQMISSCKKRNVRLAINHQMRFMEQYTEPKKIINSDAFGGLSSVNIVAGNFGMAANGTHYFEMFRYITDEEPSEVAAWFSSGNVPNPRGPQFSDRAGELRLLTPSGKRLYMNIDGNQGHGIRVIYAGPYGSLLVNELSGTMNVMTRDEKDRHLPSTRYGMPGSEVDRKIIPADAVKPSQAVLEAMLRGTDFPNGHDGRLSVAVLVAAYVSHENSHVSVGINEQLPMNRTFPWA